MWAFRYTVYAHYTHTHIAGSIGSAPWHHPDPLGYRHLFHDLTHIADALQISEILQASQQNKSETDEETCTPKRVLVGCKCVLDLHPGAHLLRSARLSPSFALSLPLSPGAQCKVQRLVFLITSIWSHTCVQEQAATVSTTRR